MSVAKIIQYVKKNPPWGGEILRPRGTAQDKIFQWQILSLKSDETSRKQARPVVRRSRVSRNCHLLTQSVADVVAIEAADVSVRTVQAHEERAAGSRIRGAAGA